MQKTQYVFTCTCGHSKQVEAADIGSSGFIVWRHVCGACGAVTYPLFKAPRARVHDGSVALQRAIHDVFAEIGPPMSVRQVYYQLSHRHVVEKDDAAAVKVQTTMTTMRRNGSLPYGYVTDHSRSFYQVKAHDDVSAAMREMQQYYRRDLWSAQPVHVEVWVEKRALISQLLPICNEFGVRLYPCGGYASISFAYEAAEELRTIDKEIHIYHLSDLDADGAYSSVCLERELREHGAEFQFHRLALRPDQIIRYGLQEALRPQKRTSTRYNGWVEQYGAAQGACELDALNPRDLRTMVHNAIAQHIDGYEWKRLQDIERVERESLAMIVEHGFQG